MVGNFGLPPATASQHCCVTLGSTLHFSETRLLLCEVKEEGKGVLGGRDVQHGAALSPQSLNSKATLSLKGESKQAPAPELFHHWTGGFLVPPGPGDHPQQQFSESRVWQAQAQGTPAPAEHRVLQRNRRGKGRGIMDHFWQSKHQLLLPQRAALSSLICKMGIDLMSLTVRFYPLQPSMAPEPSRANSGSRLKPLLPHSPASTTSQSLSPPEPLPLVPLLPLLPLSPPSLSLLPPLG